MDEVDIPDRGRLVREIEENLWEMWANFGRGPGCSLHEKDDLLWFETPIPIIPYNGVLRFQLQANVDQRIDSIVEHFVRKEAQFMWVVHPSSGPSDLRDRLQSRGLKDVEPIFGMARTLDDLPELPPLPDGIEIRKVANERDASAFYQFAAWRWHVPDEYKEHYAAIVKGFRFGHPLPRTSPYLRRCLTKDRADYSCVDETAAFLPPASTTLWQGLVFVWVRTELFERLCHLLGYFDELRALRGRYPF